MNNRKIIDAYYKTINVQELGQEMLDEVCIDRLH